MRSLTATWLGRVRYAPAFALQQQLANERARGEIGDTLLLLEHEHVYTLGRRGTDGDVLDTRGVEVTRTDRGGLATYHGPGQLVGYPILDLGPAADVPGYVHALEQALIDTAKELGIDAHRADGQRGIWVGDQKLAAIGVHVSRGVTTHGFALNISCDLEMFGGIIPCGIADKGVTSVLALTGEAPATEQVAARAAEHLGARLGRTLDWGKAGTFQHA